MQTVKILNEGGPYLKLCKLQKSDSWKEFSINKVMKIEKDHPQLVQRNRMALEHYEEVRGEAPTLMSSVGKLLVNKGRIEGPEIQVIYIFSIFYADLLQSLL